MGMFIHHEGLHEVLLEYNARKTDKNKDIYRKQAQLKVCTRRLTQTCVYRLTNNCTFCRH